MTSGGIPIGRVFGIELRLHYSWFIIFALVTLSLAISYFPDRYPNWSPIKAGLAGLLTSFLFFASLMGHELMHSRVAQRTGIGIRSITLFIFGGVSQMEEEPKKPGDEFRIAIAGPATSLALGTIFWLAWLILPGSMEFPVAVSFWIGWINIALAAFNLVPGFPLDGGRVLRSILWWRSNDLRRATRMASNIGRGVGYLFIFGGIWLAFAGNLFNGLWLILIGWFLDNAAVGSYRQVALQDMLRGHKVKEIMSQECMAVPPDMTVDHLVNDHILGSGRRCFPVRDDGKAVGLVSIHHIKELPQSTWNVKHVSDVMVDLDKVEFVRPEDDLSSLMQIMTERDVNQLPVLDDDNNLVGVVARDKLLAYIRTRGELGV